MLVGYFENDPRRFNNGSNTKKKDSAFAFLFEAAVRWMF